MFILLIFFYIILMNTIKNLVVAGGGAKNLFIIGLLQKININNVSNYAGVSSGSIVIYLLSIGYTPFEIEQLALELDLTSFMGEPSIENILLLKSITNLDNLKVVLQTLTNYKFKKDSITFQELYTKTNKIMQIGVTSLTNTSFTIFNYENYPNVNIIDAILASCSLPGIFPPYKINNSYYCDGGVLNNCPIDIFKNDIKNTIAFMFEISPYSNNFNILQYISFAIGMPFKNRTKTLLSKYPNNIIIFKDNKIPLIDFNLTKTKIKNTINYGKNINNLINKESFIKLFS